MTNRNGGGLRPPAGDSEMDRAVNTENREGGGLHFTAPEATGPRCDVPTDQERRLGIADRLKMHRWRKPVKLGDRCQCGDRFADDILVKVLNDPKHGARL